MTGLRQYDFVKSTSQLFISSLEVFFKPFPITMAGYQTDRKIWHVTTNISGRYHGQIYVVDLFSVISKKYNTFSHQSIAFFTSLALASFFISDEYSFVAMK